MKTEMAIKDKIMRLSAIVAMSENRVIGNDNRLPWHLPADLQHFKLVTLGKPIIMGRKTFESIGRPLPGRQNIIVTRDVDFLAPGCVVVHSIEAAISAASDQEEAFVIGGALLYEQMLPLVQCLYLTVIHQAFEGDTFFPVIDMSEWTQVEEIRPELDEKNVYSYSFIVLKRK
jgi:dihydrofolate reductase